MKEKRKKKLLSEELKFKIKLKDLKIYEKELGKKRGGGKREEKGKRKKCITKK